MRIESDITWLISIDEIEHWSASAQDNSNLITRIPSAALVSVRDVCYMLE